MVILLSMKKPPIHNRRYSCMQSSHSVNVIELWVIIDSTLSRMLIMVSLFNLLIQNRKLLSLKTSLIHNRRYSCMQSSYSVHVIEFWVIIDSSLSRMLIMVSLFNLLIQNRKLLSLKTSLIHNRRYSCMQSSNSVLVMEFWVIIDYTLTRMLIMVSLFNPHIQNGKPVVIEDINHP